MSSIKNRFMRGINKHYFQSEKRENLKVPKEFQNEKFDQLFNCSISLNINSTFTHFRVDDAASVIVNLNKTEF